MAFSFWVKRRSPRRSTPVDRYRILYEQAAADDLPELRAADWAILEPRYVSREMADDMRAAGTLTFGYLSVMETPTWNRERYERLEDGDFWTQDGERTHFAAWDSYLMDLRSPHYRALLVDEVEEQIVRKGLDGVFLDTVGDITEHIPAGSLQKQLSIAYSVLLGELSVRFPELLFVQNRGFDLLPSVGPHLHGLLWEDWRGDLADDEWVRLRLAMLADWQRQGLHVLTVSASDDPVHSQAACKRGFVHLTCGQGYHTLRGQR